MIPLVLPSLTVRCAATTHQTTPYHPPGNASVSRSPENDVDRIAAHLKMFPLSLRRAVHAVAGRAAHQPRIVCYDPQRETLGWDGPGAYEWDDRWPDGNTRTAITPTAEAGDTVESGEATGMCSGGGGRTAMGTRPRGISVRDPDRPSPAFREGSSVFVPPAQTNVRGFALSPSTGTAPDSSAWGGGGGGSAAAGSKSQGGRRKKPQRVSEGDCGWQKVA